MLGKVDQQARYCTIRFQCFQHILMRGRSAYEVTCTRYDQPPPSGNKGRPTPKQVARERSSRADIQVLRPREREATYMQDPP